jgi:hypothetical protein
MVEMVEGTTNGNGKTTTTSKHVDFLLCREGKKMQFQGGGQN